MSKWVIVPKLVTGKEIPSDSQAIEYIHDLYSKRNDFVHPKSRLLQEQPDWPNELAKDIGDVFSSVQKGLAAIKQATQELHKLDQSFDYLEEYKWLWEKGANVPKFSDFEGFIKTFGAKI